MAVLSACAGDGPASIPSPTPGATQTPGSGPTIDAVQSQIFNLYCLTSGCHNAADRAQNLVLEAGASWSNLVNVEAVNTQAAESGQLRVRPFSPETSFLIAKLVGPPSGEGSRMPQGGPFLSESQIDLVRQWILGGALDAAGPTATLQPTATPTVSPTSSSTPTETASPTSTSTPSPTVPPSLTPTGTLAPSATPTETATPSNTATPSPTATEVIVTLAELQATIFNPTCAVAFCHDSTSAPFSGNLNLSAGNSYSNLVGVTPDNAAAAADGFLRVREFDPDTSLSIVKVCRPQFGEALCPVPLVPAYGNPMPLVGTELTPQQVEQMRSWILRGAPETD